jgi:lipopolysaccharide biosynthesis regulator YciM
MKKLFLGSFALFLTISAFSQNGKVISAFNYMDAYNKGEGPLNLEEAIKNIDIAVTDPSTSESSKAWWYRSNIYQLASSKPELFGNKYPKASLEAVKSFQKLRDLNDPKFKDWSDAYENLRSIGNQLFNDGISAYQKKNYHDAYLFFNAISDVQDILIAKGQKANTELLTKSLGNAGLSAEYDNDYATAISTYKRLLPQATDSKVYISLISLYKKSKDTESAKKYTDEALLKYPTDKDLLIDKINFYMADGKFGDAITYLQTASAQDPKNEQLQAALGIAYEQIKDTANARKVYENLLTINSNSFEGNYGIGGMIFNQTKPIQEKMNSLGATKDDIKKYDTMKLTRDALFLQAKPYLDKANAAKPDDAEVKKALNTIDAMTRK